MAKQRIVDETKHPAKRPVKVRPLRSTHGKSSVIIECPCGANVVTYVWSWAGCGHRYCPVCNRKHGYSLISECGKTETVVDKYQKKVTPEIAFMLRKFKNLSEITPPEHNPDPHMNKYQDLALDIAELLDVTEEDIDTLGSSTTELIEQLARVTY